MKTSDNWATAELLIAAIEMAIARGCRHYSETGELLPTTLAVLECLQREGYVSVEELAPIIREGWRLAMRAHDISRVDGGGCSGTLATRWS